MSVIDDYLQQFDPPIRAELERIRSITTTLLSEHEEVISYGMPTIKHHGKPILGFDAHKHHIGIYPYSGSVISQIPELKEYETTKSAIHEEPGHCLPDSLIEKIIQTRLKQAGF